MADKPIEGGIPPVDSVIVPREEDLPGAEDRILEPIKESPTSYTEGEGPGPSPRPRSVTGLWSPGLFPNGDSEFFRRAVDAYVHRPKQGPHHYEGLANSTETFIQAVRGNPDVAVMHHLSPTLNLAYDLEKGIESFRHLQVDYKHPHSQDVPAFVEDMITLREIFREVLEEQKRSEQAPLFLQPSLIGVETILGFIEELTRYYKDRLLGLGRVIFEELDALDQVTEDAYLRITSSHQFEEVVRQAKSDIHIFHHMMKDRLRSNISEEEKKLRGELHDLEPVIANLLETQLEWVRSLREGKAVSFHGLLPPTEIRTIFLYVLDLCKTLIQEHGVQPQMDPEDDLHWRLKEPNQAADLSRILMNFISNGIKYHNPELAPQDRKVLVHLSHDEDHIIFTVQDNGRGMSPQFVEERYSQFGIRAESVIGKISGSGVGAHSALRLIHDLKGRLEVASIVKGGTTIKMFLPLDLFERVGEDAQVHRPAIKAMEAQSLPMVEVIPIHYEDLISRASLSPKSWLAVVNLHHGHGRTMKVTKGTVDQLTSPVRVLKIHEDPAQRISQIAEALHQHGATADNPLGILAIGGNQTVHDVLHGVLFYLFGELRGLSALSSDHFLSALLNSGIQVGTVRAGYENDLGTLTGAPKNHKEIIEYTNNAWLSPINLGLATFDESEDPVLITQGLQIARGDWSHEVWVHAIPKIGFQGFPATPFPGLGVKMLYAQSSLQRFRILSEMVLRGLAYRRGLHPEEDMGLSLDPGQEKSFDLDQPLPMYVDGRALGSHEKIHVKSLNSFPNFMMNPASVMARRHQGRASGQNATINRPRMPRASTMRFFRAGFR